MKATIFLTAGAIGAALLLGGPAVISLCGQETKTDLQACQEAVRLNPGDAAAYRKLGDAYEKLNRYRDACDAYKKVTQLAPDDGGAWSKLGNALREAGDEKGAIDAYKKAVKIDPGDADAHFNLASLYLDQENEDAFRDEYEIVEKLNRGMTEELRTLFKDKFGEEFTPRKKR